MGVGVGAVVAGVVVSVVPWDLAGGVSGGVETGGTGFSGDVEGVLLSAATEEADGVLLNVLSVVTEVPEPNVELGCLQGVVSEGAVAQACLASFAGDGVAPNALGPAFAKLPNPPPPPNDPVLVGFVGATDSALDCANVGCPNADWPKDDCPNAVFPKTLPPVVDWFDWVRPANAPPPGADVVVDEVSAGFEDGKALAPSNALRVLVVFS